MARILRSYAVLTVLALATVPPASADPLLQSVESLPVAITDVRLVGEWSAEGVPAVSPDESLPGMEGTPQMESNPGMNAAMEGMEGDNTTPRASESGLFRTIVATDTANGGASRLFVQWLKNSETGTSLRQTIEIPELAELNVVIFDYTYEADSEGLALYLSTYEVASGVEAEYELFLRSANDYIFQPLSN